MSILIDMEMPISCASCPCGYFFDAETMPNCNITGDSFCITEYITKRAENCPLIEIPPHGRLIDADALLSRIKESRNWIETNLGEAEKPLRIGYLAAYGETLAYIVNTPTIIESEGDDGC